MASWVHQANGKIVAETGGGSVEIVSATQGASIETGGGRIQVRQCTGSMKAETGGGNIDLGDMAAGQKFRLGEAVFASRPLKGHVHAETGGGGIELYGVPSARVETSAGGIVVKFIKTGAPPTDSKLETSAGDITVYIAPDVALSVRASVDLGFCNTRSPKTYTWPARSPRVGSENAERGREKPLLKVQTTTGDLCFRRAN